MIQGKFIVIDGPDGVGKSTQAELLVKRLKAGGFSTVHLREPGGTEVGEQIRGLLLDPVKEISPRAETLLFLASRAQLVEEKIRPALASGKILISERFNSSTIAYQGSAGGLGPEDVEKFCHFAAGGLVPDITIILDLDPEVALHRVGEKKDRLEMRSQDYHERVRMGFMQYALSHPGAAVVIKASGSKEEVHERIWGVVAGVL